jgi:coniferyl-aldehyde dehydrogenase
MRETTPATDPAPAHHDGALREILDRQREAFVDEGPPRVALRRHRIDRLMALVFDNADFFADAMAADFGTRPRTSSLFTEVLGLATPIDHIRKNTAKWMRSTQLLPAARLSGLRAEVQPSPLGVVGIIGPWNFPLSLVIQPAAAAFAAGNRVMIKMSEITTETGALMQRLAPDYFDPRELAVVTGDREVAATFAALPFDHLFFTGSAAVGQLVQRAAAQNLVPVTLELGGKNPVVISPEADLRRAAQRIARSRLLNAGQVCLCPDYVYVPAAHLDAFIGHVRDFVRQAVPTMIANDDYASMVNDANFNRVIDLVEDARRHGAQVEQITPPGETLPDQGSRKIAPTIVRQVSDQMKITTEEIFGPVLVVMPYGKISDAITYINARPAPLVSYWYGPDDRDFRSFVRSTRSGGVARNDFGAQILPSAAPFGGVGHSGMGAYHGKSGFDTFSHHRSVVGHNLPFSLTLMAAPPFNSVAMSAAERGVAVTGRRIRRRVRRGGGLTAAVDRATPSARVR